MVYTDGIHLIADTVGELHGFVRWKAGMSRSWFQDHPKHPHYDIWGAPLKRAIAHGALSVSSKDIVRLCDIFSIPS